MEILENVAFAAVLPIRLVNFLAAGILCQTAGTYLSRLSGSQRDSTFGNLQGWREHFGEGLGSPAGEQDVPGVDCARNRGREQSIVERDFAIPIFLEPLDRRQSRRHAL